MLVQRVYRALLRQAKQLEGHDLIAPLVAGSSQWGTHRFTKADSAASDVLKDLAPGLDLDLLSAEHSTTTSMGSAWGREGMPLRQLISAAFRAQLLAPHEKQARLVEEAFRVLRILLEQRYLFRCSSSCVTEGVKVDVTAKFDQTAKDFRGEQVHVYTYRVRVTNLREEPIRVLGRSWTIKNDRGQPRVHIPLDPNNAVVGQQPLLPTGHTFEYFSGTDLDTISGLQSGALLVDVFGEGRNKEATQRLIVEVAPFTLVPPGGTE
ncbi:hypothetical protein CEUSTIGMA_g4211.t1 [Chlamydomonas eustigma]|uniref:ApaG domain-containing protein n=1 Tax=Chlamydomonas eustigma TaxID=1157962 RepID=A0A250X0Y8_9CHLO|nr:hypothetical protein CEUSTIGMA_g4211.t1 [Chlamydomonas eustigma]|eukprot:GAX76764.1 hypothetical protein CEUSTIGMA_g4211.t1 [Chlamydomonas eustigma]